MCKTMAPIYGTTGRNPRNHTIMLCLLATLLLDSIICSLSVGDALLANEQIIDGQTAQTLISAKGTFELGFFSPENQLTRYLGVWFANMKTKRIVWVANRATPITTQNSTLILTKDGNLALRDISGTVVWSTGTTLAKNVQARILDSGNFVLADSVSGRILWQSFDYPSDTLLPEMRLGYDLQINHERYISSWKAVDDPTPGNYTYKLDPKRLPELLLLSDTTLKYRSGPWNGVSFNGIPQVKTVLVYHVVSNQGSTYYWYDNTDTSVLWHLFIGSDGLMHRMFNRSGDWVEYWHYPQDNCDFYGYCGPYGICTNNDCSCLTESYKIKSQANWNLRKFSDGCVRNEPLNCTEAHGFIKKPNLKLPDTIYAKMRNTSRLDECKSLCLESCNCTAFAMLGGNQCVTWQGDLIDMVHFPASGDDLYVRTVGSDSSSSGETKKHSTLIIIIAAATSFGVFVIVLTFIFVICYRRRRQIKRTSPSPSRHTNPEVIEESNQFAQTETFDIKTLRAATNNFHDNKLGEGCFGPVYKASLDGGRVIAVKRLAKDACKGHRQFVNEVNLLSKLSHKNLVKLHGYCIEDRERILCYEYMSNGSLDQFLDEPAKRKSYVESKFEWKTRSMIIEEISSGIVYLHEECGERIVHRDLKPGNILLDENMIPKISDFGFAKLCRKDRRSTYTEVFAGTMGYMAPEMLRYWKVSSKADVFSFGIIIMEIITGRIATSFSSGIINHVASYWMESKELELIDLRIKENADKEQILRFIIISLLCVQEDKDKRPEMRDINMMLNGTNSVLPYVPRNLFVGWGVSFDGPPRYNGSSTDYTETSTPSTQSVSSFY